MIYRILFYFANIVIRIYYRRIHVTGLKSIPKNKPLIIVSNHPNGFLEPIIMACLFPIELHFLVRGDLFEKKSLKWLLTSTNQVPIYRFKDGIAALRNNQKTIAKTVEVLSQNKAIIIFAEGSTDANWYLREFKKGMARMAFQCLDENQDLDLQILPVGITFQKSSSPGSEVILNVGEAFSVRPFYVKKAKEAKDQMDNLTAHTYDEIRKLIVHVEEKVTKDEILQSWTNYSSIFHNGYLPRVTKDVEIFEKIQNKNNGYKNRKKDFFSHVQNTLFFLLGIPGFIFWFVPVFAGKLITKKFVKQEEFISSVNASSTAILCVIYTLICFVVFSISFGMINTLLILTSMTISGVLMHAAWEFRNR